MGRRRLMRKIWKRNAELRVAMENAETANRMKAAFIRSMSHEIRTPLNAINGFTQVLCSDLELSAEEKTDIVQRITSSSEAITIIINELLELSAGESVTIDIDDLLPVHVNEVCRKVMVEAEKDNEKKLKMNFYTTIPDDFTIKSNEETVGKILTKIVDNAMKFTDKGHVDINVSNRDNYVEISVEDTGVGIPEEQHEAIFENFVKLDDFKNGAGLGLSICRRLVKLLGGRIFIDSQYNIGSRFVVQLPTNGTPLE
jgi:signal transduction histidine kinase